LLQRGLEVRRLGRIGAMEVIGPDADLIADAVRDAVADNGARLRRVVRRRRRLEDLFHAADEATMAGDSA
jgi:hypothetical protein